MARVSYALRRANRDRCPAVGPLLGWTLHNAAQYSPRIRAQAENHFRFSGGYPSVLAIVADGPAARAGLRPDDTLLAINDIALGDPHYTGPASFEPLSASISILDRGLSAPAVLTVERGQDRLKIRVEPLSGCAYETQLDPSPDLRAAADARRVFISSAFVDFAENDDELAVLLGHEYAHVLLGHPPDPEVGAAPRRAGASRRSEAEEIAADRLGLELARRAGFDFRAGPNLLERVARKRPWLAPFLSRRIARIRQDVDRLSAAPTSP